MNSEPLLRALFLAVRLILYDTYWRRKISQYYYVVHIIMRVKAKLARFVKRLRFDYVNTLLECAKLLREVPYAMHHGAMETICLFGMTYSVLQTSCLCLRSSSIVKFHRPSNLWVWIKILFIELLLVLRTWREQPCCLLCIVFLFSFSAIIQVSA